MVPIGFEHYMLKSQFKTFQPHSMGIYLVWLALKTAVSGHQQNCGVFFAQTDIIMLV